jgi:hypothetical protein
MSSESRTRTLAWLVGAGMTAQIALLWVQGAQLYRQHQVLLNIQEDLQDLTDAVDQLGGGNEATDESWSPSREARPAHRAHALRRARARLRGRVRQGEPKPEPKPEGEADPAIQQGMKDMQATRESAQKAIEQSRDIRSKLSIEENARKADQKAQIEAAQNSWQRWAWGAVAFVALALFLGRAYVNRRS